MEFTISRDRAVEIDDSAKLDDGATWPVACAVKELTPSEQQKFAALVTRAAR